MNSAVDPDPAPGTFKFVDLVGYYCRAHCNKLAACSALYVAHGVTIPLLDIVWTWVRLEQQGWNHDYSCVVEYRQPPGRGIFPITLLATEMHHGYPEHLRHSWAQAPLNIAAAATN